MKTTAGKVAHRGYSLLLLLDLLRLNSLVAKSFPFNLNAVCPGLTP
jgi:hypothetical protein